MKKLSKGDLANVSGGSWWSPSNIYDLINSGRNEPAVSTPGLPGVELKPVDSSVGVMIGIGFLTTVTFLAALIINKK